MIVNLKRRYYSIFVCGLFAILTSTVAKPSINFSLTSSSLPSFASLTQDYVGRRHAEQMKAYSGNRQKNDSLLMVYYHDQTVAIVELGPEKLLIGCELIEIYNDNAGKKLLKQLSQINRPLEIKFKEMLNLMNQCDVVEKQNRKRLESRSVDTGDYSDNSFVNRKFKGSPFSLFSGIIPGTKWCGTGDIAESYSDLGTEVHMDSCCRTHDLCPIKIRAYEAKYNITNNSLYTNDSECEYVRRCGVSPPSEIECKSIKTRNTLSAHQLKLTRAISHCVCDDMLFECLKKLNNLPAAQLMGSIYFNIVQVPCIHNTPKGVQYRKAREGF